jgi:mono/diheme cytochrome c family protein
MRSIVAAFVVAVVSGSLTASDRLPQASPSAAARRAAAPAGHADNGKKIYVSYGCYECHNYAANGGVAGARLAPHPLAWDEFSRYVRKPTGEMPPYTTKVLTDAELADIYAFLVTIPEPPAAPPGRTPIARSRLGRR